MSKEETKVWTNGKTNSFLSPSNGGKNEDDGSLRRNPSSNDLRLSSTSTTKRTKQSNDQPNTTASPPKPRALETSASDRGIRMEPISPPSSKIHSASCIGLTNFTYPVVNVHQPPHEKDQQQGGTTSEATAGDDEDAPPDPNAEIAARAQRRVMLRKQLEAIKWDWCTPETQQEERQGYAPSPSSSNNKGSDIEGLMHKAWAKQYKEGELYISVLDAQIETSRSLPGTEVVVKMQRKVLASAQYGRDMLVGIDEKPMGDLSIQIHSTNRLGHRKKMGRCSIVLSKLEDGKTIETWYSFNKKKRKGSNKLKGYLKVKVMYISSVTRNKDYTMAKENYQKITSLLFEKEGVIVSTLCKLYKEEDLSMALVRLFNSQRQSSYLLMNLMIREIYFSDDASTLFRRDSMATKAARNFFSLVAKSYLKRYILPFVAYISYEVSKGSAYEVDPSKLKATDDITANAGRLIAAAKRFLSPILDSCSYLPVSLRMFFCNLSTVLKVRVKTGNPVGALFFLRFVCPAILFPSQYDLMDTPLDPAVFRALVLVTKILQNLVNGCLFHEEYMTIFNSFISDNIGNINAFFDLLCTPPNLQNVTPDDVLPPYTDDQLVKLLSIVVRKLHMFFDKLRPQIDDDPLFQTLELLDKEHQLFLFAQLKTLFLERILTSPTGDESEMKHT